MEYLLAIEHSIAFVTFICLTRWSRSFLPLFDFFKKLVLNLSYWFLFYLPADAVIHLDFNCYCVPFVLKGTSPESRAVSFRLFVAWFADPISSALVLGHSFVKRLRRDLLSKFDPRADINFNLAGTVFLLGVCGRNVATLVVRSSHGRPDRSWYYNPWNWY